MVIKTHHINTDIKGYYREHLFGNKYLNTKKGRRSGGISIYFKTALKDKIKLVEINQCGFM